MLADLAAGALSIVLGLSMFEKGTVLFARSAAWHPVIVVSRRRRRYAIILMTGGLMSEVLISTGLAMGLREAGAVFVALLVIYTAAGIGVYTVRPSEKHSTCRCLFGLLEARELVGFLGRNLVLALLAVPVIVTSPTLTPLAILAGVGVVLTVHLAVEGLDELGLRMQRAMAGRTQGSPKEA